MENLGDILKRLATTKRIYEGDRVSDVPDGPSVADDMCGLCGGRGWFTADVPAGHSDFGRIITCQCQMERLEVERATRLLHYSNLGNLSRFKFESLDLDRRFKNSEDRRLFGIACQEAAQYAENPGGWLALTGPNGSGKTHLAAAIANRCIEKGYAVFFVHVSDLLDHLRSSFAPDGDVAYTELFEQVRNTPLLILDGLGAHSATPWAQEKLEQIVNHRYNAQLPTVITTVSDMEDLDPYIGSRLKNEELSRVLQVGSRDPGPVHQLGWTEPELLGRMSFETFDVRGNNPDRSQRAILEGAYRAARNFAADPDGWLTLFGGPGVGKTHLAVAIAGECMAKGRSVFFAFVPELLDYLRYTFTPESRVTYDKVFDEVKNTPLLILDDMGQERSSPWADEKLYQIIVHRHNTRLPTIITSALDFTEQTGPISSRVRDPHVGQLVRIDAPDYRIRTREPVNRGTRSRQSWG